MQSLIQCLIGRSEATEKKLTLLSNGNRGGTAEKGSTGRGADGGGADGSGKEGHVGIEGEWDAKRKVMVMAVVDVCDNDENGRKVTKFGSAPS